MTLQGKPVSGQGSYALLIDRDRFPEFPYPVYRTQVIMSLMPAPILRECLYRDQLDTIKAFIIYALITDDDDDEKSRDLQFYMYEVLGLCTVGIKFQIIHGVVLRFLLQKFFLHLSPQTYGDDVTAF